MPNVGLNIGLKALLTAQTALDNVGHNISNASTPGYSRQHVLISADPAITVRGLAIGNGVSAQQILRTVDLLVQRRLVQQQGSISQLNQRLTGMSQVESLFAEPPLSGFSDHDRRRSLPVPVSSGRDSFRWRNRSGPRRR